jgi:hypothetical protein
MAAAEAITLSHLSTYKSGSPSSITKGLENKPHTTKIVHDLAYTHHMLHKVHK